MDFLIALSFMNKADVSVCRMIWKIKESLRLIIAFQNIQILLAFSILKPIVALDYILKGSSEKNVQILISDAHHVLWS